MGFQAKDGQNQTHLASLLQPDQFLHSIPCPHEWAAACNQILPGLWEALSTTPSFPSAATWPQA